MRRTINAFTLTPRASELLDDLVTQYRRDGIPQQLAIYIEAEKPTVPDPAAPGALDEFDLKQADYEALYNQLPSPEDWKGPGGKVLVKAPLPITTPSWDVLNRQIRKRLSDPTKQLQVFDDIRLRQKENRRELRKYTTAAKKARLPRPPSMQHINRSRITEAFILLGHEVLQKQERVAHLGVDVEGSKRKDAGEGQDKLSHTKRRKAVTV